MASKLQHMIKLPVHFFKVILPRTLLEGKLMIPNTFVREYGEGLPNTVFLKLPSGAEWKINVAKHGDKVWFEKGWKEFAVHHSLAHGHFLVFKYEGTSCFEVLILAKCGLEIEYPFNGKEGNVVAKNQEFQALEINNLKEDPPCRKRTENSPLACLQPCKKTRANEDVKVETKSNLPKEALHHSARVCKGEHSRRGTSTSKIRKQKEVKSLQKRRRSRALEKANAFRSQFPSFIVVMKPSYIDAYGPLNIPVDFVTKYLDLEKKRGIVTLQALNGRDWYVTFLIRINGRKSKFELSNGWKAFARANNLKLGDVCVFELIHKTEIAFRVSIFRESDSPNRRSSQGNLKQLNKEKSTLDLKPNREFVSDSEVYEASGKSNTNYPFFREIMKSRHLHRWSMSLPASFVKGFIKPGQEIIVTVQVGEKSWKIKLIRPPKMSASYFSAGWSAFVRENDLHVGDVCLFNWLKTDVIKVSIFKHSEV